MAAKDFLRHLSGIPTRVFGVQTSGGAANAGDIPSLDDTGRLDASMMPVGIGANTVQLPATEALAAGNYVNIWNSSGTPSVRKADASTSGKEAHGFVLAAVASGANATVYLAGQNTQVTGQTAGVVFLSATTPGTGSATAPSTTGQVSQKVGFAVSATAVDFQPFPQIQL